jgi:hypothetical protein
VILATQLRDQRSLSLSTIAIVYVQFASALLREYRGERMRSNSAAVCSANALSDPVFSGDRALLDATAQRVVHPPATSVSDTGVDRGDECGGLYQVTAALAFFGRKNDLRHGRIYK